jgi:hypothetical protein
MALIGACTDGAGRGPTNAGPNDAAVTAEAGAPELEAGLPLRDGGVDLADGAGGSAPVAEGGHPDRLSETGLYAELATEALAPGVVAFEPRFELWSDGSTKRRWLYLPPGQSIDATDPDGWVFPVGTKTWKEFTSDGVRVETRLLEKSTEGWRAVAYLWNEGDADAIPEGRVNARGTTHDVPSESDCFACHAGSDDMLLGVSAIQLGWPEPADGGGDAGGPQGVTLASLVAEGRLLPAPARTTVDLPGTALDQAALGRLHVDCGHCHRPGTVAWGRGEMDLRLVVGALGSLEETGVFQTAVGVPTSRIFDGITARIQPGVALESAVYVRMATRDSILGMPTIGSKLVDPGGIETVRAFIDALPVPGAVDAGDGG